jgi:cyclophilin family peptidyl-prolyl cis-trans isomerase
MNRKLTMKYPFHFSAVTCNFRRLAFVAAASSLAACGGGGGSGGGGGGADDPTVSAVNINPIGFNVGTLMVTITGTKLAAGLSVTSPQCATLTRAATPASSATTAYYQCNNTAPVGTTVQVSTTRTSDGGALASGSFTIGAATVFAQAVAGKDAVAPGPGQAAVPGSAKYSQVMTVEVTGTNVNQGLDVSSTSCSGMALSVSPPLISTPSKAYYLCKADSANGLAQVSITPLGQPDVTLANPLFFVELPQVTLTIKVDTLTLGTVVLDMDPNATPITVDNFLRYVNSGFYDRTIFHKLIKETVPAPFELIQAGAYAPTSGLPAPAAKATQAPIALEFDPSVPVGVVRNQQWSVGMSRLPGNEPDRQNSATAEFYINMIDNPGLDPTNVNAGNAVFAIVTAATRPVVTSIANAACTDVVGFSECLPLPNVIIDTAVQTR